MVMMSKIEEDGFIFVHAYDIQLLDAAPQVGNTPTMYTLYTYNTGEVLCRSECLPELEGSDV